MYEVDHLDEVREVTDVPQSSVGAPCPVVVCDEHHIFLAYYLQDIPSDWDGSTPRIISAETTGEPIAVVTFDAPYAHMLGPPNDEALSGHPLSSRGLEPYGVFEVSNSSWVRSLERMNRVHPYHEPERFENLRHLIFSFHDSVFECVAQGFSVTTKTTGSLIDVVAEMSGRLSEQTRRKMGTSLLHLGLCAGRREGGHYWNAIKLSRIFPFFQPFT